MTNDQDSGQVIMMIITAFYRRFSLTGDVLEFESNSSSFVDLNTHLLID